MKLVAPTLAMLVALAVVLAVMLDRDEQPSQPGQGAPATAPIAPRGVPAAPACATQRPGTGTRAEENRTVQLPQPAPERFAPTSPRRALAEFMDAWHDRAWDRMATWASPSWRMLTRGDDGQLMRRRYAAYRLRGWTVLAALPRPSVVRFRVLTAHRDIAPRIERERLRFVLTREDERGALVTEGGRWGVFVSERPDAGSACPADE